MPPRGPTMLAALTGTTRMLEKYLVNPPMRRAVQLGIVPDILTLLETTGRRSGRLRHTPVGGAFLDDAFWLVAERGRDTDYVRNLTHDPHVRFKTRGTWHTGRATPVPDDDPWQRRRRVNAHHGVIGHLDGLLWRAMATEPITVRIDPDPSSPEQATHQ